MSTKTVALENSVYERLAREKRASESFTKVVDRLLQVAAAAEPTCAAAVAGAAALWGRRSAGEVDSEAATMERVMAEGREDSDWEVERPDQDLGDDLPEIS